MKKYKIKSFCKINLTLNIIKKLSNGYHIIRSIITFSNLHDLLTLYEIKAKKDKVVFTGRYKNNINFKSNTITKLLFLLREESYLKKKSFYIGVKKNIPHGSGLGGGSSNAAVLLNFLVKKMNLKIKKNKIYQIANKIGSDVPISLEKKNTYLCGEKNKIVRINKKFRLNLLIVYPNIICSTKSVYKKNRKFTSNKVKFNFLKFNRKKFLNFLLDGNNDLEQVVTKHYPKVKKLINFIKSQNGCYFSRITGSGSACIGIFSNVKTANYTKKLIQSKFPKYWCLVSKTI